jgi:primosomal replication protein N
MFTKNKKYINHAFLKGFIAQEPKLTPFDLNGKSVYFAYFQLCTEGVSIEKKTQEAKTYMTYVPVQATPIPEEAIHNYKKGKQLIVTGPICMSTAANKRKFFMVKAEEISFIDQKDTTIIDLLTEDDS